MKQSTEKHRKRRLTIDQDVRESITFSQIREKIINRESKIEEEQPEKAEPEKTQIEIATKYVNELIENYMYKNKKN